MDENWLHEKIAEISRTIYSYCRAKTPSQQDAEDLSQDILLELTKSVKNIRNENAFYAFMWGVAGNVYKQWYRKKLKNNTCELSEDIPSEDQLSEDDSERLYLLRRELTLLSEKYRKATILYYIEGRSCSEISDLLAISESMVKYLLFKSRKILKEGMNMERNLGELSYNPKALIPMYSGQGPNQFWQFMQSKIKQNIVCACYNDSLTVQQISLETGIPLPYLDDEIKEMTEKKILVYDGKRYSANVLIINRECTERYALASSSPAMPYTCAIELVPRPRNCGKMYHIQCDRFSPLLISSSATAYIRSCASINLSKEWISILPPDTSRVCNNDYTIKLYILQVPSR